MCVSVCSAVCRISSGRGAYGEVRFDTPGRMGRRPGLGTVDRQEEKMWIKQNCKSNEGERGNPRGRRRRWRSTAELGSDGSFRRCKYFISRRPPSFLSVFANSHGSFFFLSAANILAQLIFYVARRLTFGFVRRRRRRLKRHIDSSSSQVDGQNWGYQSKPTRSRGEHRRGKSVCE